MKPEFQKYFEEDGLAHLPWVEERQPASEYSCEAYCSFANDKFQLSYRSGPGKCYSILGHLEPDEDGEYVECFERFSTHTKFFSWATSHVESFLGEGRLHDALDLLHIIDAFCHHNGGSPDFWYNFLKTDKYTTNTDVPAMISDLTFQLT